MAESCEDAGDVAWVLICTVLVLGMMPALAFFEAGLLRSVGGIAPHTRSAALVCA